MLLTNIDVDRKTEHFLESFSDLLGFFQITINKSGITREASRRPRSFPGIVGELRKLKNFPVKLSRH